MKLTVFHLKRIIKEAVNEAHDDMVSGPINPGDDRGQIHHQPKSASAGSRAAYNQRRREKSAAERARAEQERVGALNMPPKKEEKIARFIEDIHSEFGNVGEESGSVSWDEVMDFARQKGVRTTPDEIERVFLNSHVLDSGLPYIMRVTASGFDFDDSMAL